MGNDHQLRGTFSADRALGQRDLASLRPATEAAPRARKPRVVREVTNGIVCFCGERFPEARALDFMLHLRAEVGEDLARLERYREYIRKWHKKPENLAKAAQRRRERYQNDPEFRARELEAQRRRRADPEKRARQNEAQRRRRQDPELRARKLEASRRRYAAKRAEQQAGDAQMLSRGR